MTAAHFNTMDTRTTSLLSGKPIEVNKSDLTLLYELANVHQLYPLFEEDRKGPQHAITFNIKLRVGDLMGVGKGTSKKEARLAAATVVLEQLKKRPLPEGVTPYWSKPHMELVDPAQRPFFFYRKNPITALSEILVVRKHSPAVYKEILAMRKHSPAEYKQVFGEYRMEVRVGQRTCQAVGPTKKQAKFQAAKTMLYMMGFKEQMKRNNPEDRKSHQFRHMVLQQQEMDKLQARLAFRASLAQKARSDSQTNRHQCLVPLEVPADTFTSKEVPEETFTSKEVPTETQ